MKRHRTFTVARSDRSLSRFAGTHILRSRKANESSRTSPAHDAATRRRPRIAGSVAAVILGILSTHAVCALPAAISGKRPHVPYAVSCQPTLIGTSATKRTHRDSMICSSWATHGGATIGFENLHCLGGRFKWSESRDIHMGEKSAWLTLN